jgi:hypothetical protein
MAGSYNHVVTQQGNLRSNESFVQMVENLGDAYETVEEMYGMIWYLADRVAFHRHPLRDIVEQAQQNYQRGLEIARESNHRA